MRQEIILCPKCKGEGKYFYLGLKEPVTDICTQCFGSGRLIQETTVILKPFKDANNRDNRI